VSGFQGRGLRGSSLALLAPQPPTPGIGARGFEARRWRSSYLSHRRRVSGRAASRLVAGAPRTSATDAACPGVGLRGSSLALLDLNTQDVVILN
jgi:hypothetical protein